MWCWMNGQYVQDHELVISPLDHGFLYGLGFFETFRTYDGIPFLFDEHFARLTEALATYRIAMPYSKETLLVVIEELNNRHGQVDGYFRLNVSAGNGGVGLQLKHYDAPTIIIFRKELPAVTAIKKAYWLTTIRNTPEQSKRFKSHHYANNILARQELTSLQEHEGFFVTETGNIAEGITSNIFWVIDGVLYTPSLETGILNGITRQAVIALAHANDIKVREGLFAKTVLEEAQECFVTTSVQELIAIASLDNRLFSTVEGPIYTLLSKCYKEQINGV